jgi:hypothetical protein
MKVSRRDSPTSGLYDFARRLSARIGNFRCGLPHPAAREITSTYRVRFDGKYRMNNYAGADANIYFNFSAPFQGSVYDNSLLAAGGKEISNLQIRFCASSRSLS